MKVVMIGLGFEVFVSWLASNCLQPHKKELDWAEILEVIYYISNCYYTYMCQSAISFEGIEMIKSVLVVY